MAQNQVCMWTENNVNVVMVSKMSKPTTNCLAKSVWKEFQDEEIKFVENTPTIWPNQCGKKR